MKNKTGIALFRASFLFLLAAALSPLAIAASANYSQGAYGSGVYGAADPSESASSSSSDSSSGSAGSSGTGAPATASATDSSTQMWASSKSDETLAMKIKSENIAIKQVDFAINKDLKGVEVTVKKLSAEPSDAEKISEKVYQFLDIKTKNIEKEDIAGVTMRFEVAKSWIESEKILPADIVLKHYKTLRWEELPTAIIIVPNNTNSITYEATASSFSYFAISIKKDALAGAGAVLNESCKESWECTEWGSCENSILERVCADKNLCGTTADKPAESKDCSNLAEGAPKDGGAKKSQFSFGKIVLWLFILAGIAGAGMGGYYVYQNYSEYALGSAKTAQAESRALSQEDMARLNGYIIKCLSRGFNSVVVEKQLLSVGWPKEIVDRQILEIIKRYRG